MPEPLQLESDTPYVIAEAGYWLALARSCLRRAMDAKTLSEISPEEAGFWLKILRSQREQGLYPLSEEAA